MGEWYGELIFTPPSSELMELSETSHIPNRYPGDSEVKRGRPRKRRYGRSAQEPMRTLWL